MKTKRLFILSVAALFLGIMNSFGAGTTNIALGASILGDSGSERNEPSSKIIDGKYEKGIGSGEKWCKNPYRNTTHWVVIDLGDECSIESFTIYDGSWNENGVENFSEYNIYVSSEINASNANDASIWTADKIVVGQTEKNDEVKIDALSEAVTGRYVKLEILNFNVLRIWEFQIFGKKYINPKLISQRFGSIYARSGAFNDGEEAAKLIDGNFGSKWCAGGNNHWVIVDLGVECDIDSIAIYDCRTKETEPNLGSYKLYAGNTVDSNNNLLNDAEEASEPFLDITVSNPNDASNNIKEHKVSVKGRYVKFVPVNSDNKTIRIYELQIFGNGPKIMLEKIEDQIIVGGQIIPMSIAYSLEDKKTDFSYEITASNAMITISDEIEQLTEEDETLSGNISFNITSSDNKFEATNFTVKIANAGEEFSRTFNVKNAISAIDEDLYVNVAQGKSAGTWDYPYGGSGNAWGWTAGSAITDGDDATPLALNKRSSFDVIVDLADQFIISGLRLVSQTAQGITGFTAAVSPETGITPVDKNEAEAGYVLQSGSLATGTAYLTLNNPSVNTGSIKIKSTVASWAQGDHNIYELAAYCERPVLQEQEDIALNTIDTKAIELDFDLKGFCNADKSQISVDITPDCENISISDQNLNYEENKLNFTISSTGNTSGNIVITKSHAGLPILVKSIPVSANGTTENKLVDGNVKVWPSVLTAGNMINVETINAESVRLISLQGAVVAEQAVSSNVSKISTENLQSGTYMLQVISAENVFKPVKIVVK